MTICIGIRDKKNNCCYVGADCGVSHSYFYTKTTTPKVFHPYGRTDIVVGCAGSIRMFNLLLADSTMFECLPEDRYPSDDKLIQDTDFFDYNEFVLENNIVVWKPTDKQKTIANDYKNYEYFENNSYHISVDTDKVICDLYEAQTSSDTAICSLYEMIMEMNNES